MPRRFIHSMIDRRSSSTERSMPFRPTTPAEERITETPGFSGGTGTRGTSRPWPHLGGPAGDVVAVEEDASRRTSYSGCRGGYGEGRLPEPFGPIRAWISPGWTARSGRARSLSTMGPACKSSRRKSSARAKSNKHYGDSGNGCLPGGVTLATLSECPPPRVQPRAN